MQRCPYRPGWGCEGNHHIKSLIWEVENEAGWVVFLKFVKEYKESKMREGEKIKGGRVSREREW